jgi:hypothetical protein
MSSLKIYVKNNQEVKVSPKFVYCSSVYKIWNQPEFDLFVQKARNAGIHIEEFKPVTLSKDESALLLEFYDKNERLILTALETMRFSTPWNNGEDIDAPDADLRDQLEATLRRIRIRKNRKS